MVIKPKISVLMPVYNAEKFLHEAIDSILNQTFGDFEFIIINDASTDNSKQLILSYQDSRIRYYENKTNLGVAKTLNKGLGLAKGKYIARMDADDISLPNRFELEYESLMTDKNLVLVCSLFDYIDERSVFLSTYRRAFSSEEIFYRLQFRNCFAHPTVIFNKKVIVDDFGGYNDKYEAEDADLWLRLSKKHKIVQLDKVLARVRVSKQSKTMLFRKAINDSTVSVARNNLQPLIGRTIELDVIRILVDQNPLSYSPQKIKKALSILEEVNIRILEQYPSFLDKSILKKSGENKENMLKKYLLVTACFDSIFGLFFKIAYKLYRSTKRVRYF